MKRRKYVPNLARTFNVYTQRWRVPWDVLSAAEKRKRFERAVRAQANGLSVAHVSSFEEFARRQRQFDRYQPRFSSRTALGRKMPPLFGTPARTQALVILMLTGPITVRELARARRGDSSSTFRVVEALIRAGLVLKAPTRRRYVGVNRTHPCFKQLATLLSALAVGFGVRLGRIAQRRKTLPGRTAPRSSPIDDGMFGSPLRSRLTLLLAAMGTGDARQLSRLLAENYNSVQYAAKALERSKLLKSQQVGARRVYFLADSYPGAVEYRRFLLALLRVLPRYDSLAAAVNAVTRRYC